MDGRTLYEQIHRHLLEDEKPSLYLERVSSEPVFSQYPFDMLDRLKQTHQSPVFHPEGNVWNHTLLVTDEAAGRRAESANPHVLMWAALLHDIGKPATTREKNGKITAYNHDTEGAKLARKFLRVFTDNEAFVSEVCELIRYHMHILYVVKGLPFADVKGMREKTDVREVALLGLCDRLGRTNCDREKEGKNIGAFLSRCGSIDRKNQEC